MIIFSATGDLKYKLTVVNSRYDNIYSALNIESLYNCFYLKCIRQAKEGFPRRDPAERWNHRREG